MSAVWPSKKEHWIYTIWVQFLFCIAAVQIEKRKKKL